MTRNLLVVLALFACHGFGQSIGIGIKGGLRATDDFPQQNGISPESPPYAFGPMLDIKLPLGFAFEADALYSRVGFTLAYASLGAVGILKTDGASWEFPLMIKHTIPFPRVKPYAEVGYAPRRTTLSYSGRSTVTTPGEGLPGGFSGDLGSAVVSHGLVVGGGVELAVGSMRIAPEVRYTRSMNGEVGRAYSFFRGAHAITLADQLQVLVGVSWRLGSR